MLSSQVKRRKVHRSKTLITLIIILTYFLLLAQFRNIFNVFKLDQSALLNLEDNSNVIFETYPNSKNKLKNKRNDVGVKTDFSLLVHKFGSLKEHPWTNKTLIPEEEKRLEYMTHRGEYYNSWLSFNGTSGKYSLLADADANGIILDFAIVGWPKCGTTSLVANLGAIAPIPVSDVCAPLSQQVYYSYINWPKLYGANKIFRGTKCPLHMELNWLEHWSKHLPKTKLITGIRHPVLWLQSFIRMQGGERNIDPYHKAISCNENHTISCTVRSCPFSQLYCIDRSRFHVSLARMGKTALTPEERKWLRPNDWDAGERIHNIKVKNPIFLYEQTQLKEAYLWEDLALYIGVPEIKNEKRHSSGGSSGHFDICDEKYDMLRARIMPIAHEMAIWLQKYFIPVALDNERPDVVIPNIDAFGEITANYTNDPCGRLVRKSDGDYTLSNTT